ncbi:hypothetical protein ACVQ8P_08015 [Dellaglioa sp. BT-FLS60]
MNIEFNREFTVGKDKSKLIVKNGKYGPSILVYLRDAKIWIAVTNRGYLRIEKYINAGNYQYLDSYKEEELTNV